jgi:hypothetical protein
MKKIIVVFAVILSFKMKAVVSFGGTYVIPHSYGPSCNQQEYVEVGFFVNTEVNNATFQIQRSHDPNFSWAITGTAYFNGTFSGCGTCGFGQYTVNDYGPFQPGEVWHYRVKATSNFSVNQYKDLGTYTTNLPTVLNWVNQVTHSVATGSSPSTESSYSWAQESKSTQGVTISLMQTEISKIYLEENNHKLNFSVQSTTPFINLDVSVDNSGYFNLYNGSGTTGYLWSNSSSYFTTQGLHNLKVKFMSMSSTIYLREYQVYVVPKSDGLYMDNYCNTMRVWKGSDPTNGFPLILSEGFDAYNTKSEQYYRQAGNDLFNCLLSKGFNIYVVNYNLNSQSIKNNGAIFQSAIRYVSSINGNKKVVATGMSMGGVINRYACAKAENDGNPLPISKFITLDAPHQGAVISGPLQDWRKSVTVGDGFAEHASNNDAAKELLNYNAYDPSGSIHTSFYGYLNSLNGDGYPHLVEKIGVSFSTTAPNPNTSGKWFYVHVTGVPGYQNQNFFLTPEETVAGSFLPSVNVDPMPLTSPKYLTSALISLFRPFSDPNVSIVQYLDPTFIPHNSSLDIVSGVSKFDKVIIPSATGFHDVVPSDVIEKIVNALIEDKVYVQNKTYSNVMRTIIANETIYAGKNVTTSIAQGDVNITNSSSIHFKAGKEIQILPGLNVSAGTDFSAEIELVQCDGSTEFQYMRTAMGNTDEQTKSSYEVDSSSYQIVYDKNGINEEKTPAFDYPILIFPNPSNGNFTIENKSPIAASTMIVKDFTGKSVYIDQIKNNQKNEFNLNFLENGVYIIEVTDSETPRNVKIIINK